MGSSKKKNTIPGAPCENSGNEFLASGLDVGVDADNDGFAVDAGFCFLVAVAACDGERLAGGRRTRGVQRDFNVEDVVFDGGFHWLVVLG